MCIEYVYLCSIYVVYIVLKNEKSANGARRPSGQGDCSAHIHFGAGGSSPICDQIFMVVGPYSVRRQGYS